MPKPPLTAPPANGRHLVLAQTGTRSEGGATIASYGYVEVSAAQALAYANGDPNWRAAGAGPSSSWLGRTWRRISGA